MKHLNFQALAENKVLKVTGVKHASEVATCLQVKGFGEIIKEGSQSFFHINTIVFFDRQYNERGYFYFNKPIELRVI